MSKIIKANTNTENKLTLAVPAIGGKTRERLIAEASFSSGVASALTASTFAKSSFGAINLNEAIDVIREKSEKVTTGDLSGVEATLSAQATTLDAMFNELAKRAALNMGEHLGATETYLRLAFKAQTQCRATIETLAEIKYPKAATFVRQQNVAYQQQVNNGGEPEPLNSTRTGAPAHGNSENQSNELLNEATHEKVDSRRTGATGRANHDLETVETVNRSKDSRRKSGQ